MTAPPATYPGFPPPTPQYPGQPSYPVAPGQLPAYQYAPGYPPVQPAAPTQPLAQGSVDDFFNQPTTGGGKSLSFQGKAPGTRFVGIVTRPITSGDIQQQTDTMQRPQYFRDGRPKFVMKVPLQMQPSPEYPDGLAQWFVKGQARDELVRAMAEAGAPAGPPEAGSIIDITFTGTRPSGPGLNPANQFRVVYNRPGAANGNGNTAQQAAPPPPPPPAPPPAQYAQPPVDPAQAQAAANVAAQFPQAAPVQQPAQAPAMPEGLNPEQRQLLARLTGQQG